MASLYDELKALVRALNDANVPYALCGALAMAVHGFVRATENIELLVQSSEVGRISGIVAELDYTHPRPRRGRGDGSVQGHRVAKVVGEDQVLLHLVTATPVLEQIWNERERREWQEGTFWVVSRQGLIELASRLGSALELDDTGRPQSGSKHELQGHHKPPAEPV